MAALLLQSATGSSQSPAKQDMDRTAQHLMEAQVAYEKMQPNGMSIEAKEIGRAGSSGKDLVVQYHLMIRGAKSGALFQEVDWPLTADQPSKSLAGISVGTDGVLLCPEKAQQCGDGGKPGDPIKFIIRPQPGEPTRLAFESKGVKIGLVIDSDPIKSHDKLCTLEAIRLTPKFEVAYITGSGYPANSEVHYKVAPLGDKPFVVKADASGTIRTMIVPQVGGNASFPFTIKVDEADCSPEVSYTLGG